jgi:hypothetical protein
VVVAAAQRERVCQLVAPLRARLVAPACQAVPSPYEGDDLDEEADADAHGHADGAVEPGRCGC